MHSVLSSISTALDPHAFATAIEERGQLSKFSCSIGSTNALFDEHMSDPHVVPLDDDDIPSVDMDSQFEASATHASPAKGVTHAHLSKI